MPDVGNSAEAAVSAGAEVSLVAVDSPPHAERSNAPAAAKAAK